MSGKLRVTRNAVDVVGELGDRVKQIRVKLDKLEIPETFQVRRKWFEVGALQNSLFTTRGKRNLEAREKDLAKASGIPAPRFSEFKEAFQLTVERVNKLHNFLEETIVPKEVAAKVRANASSAREARLASIKAMFLKKRYYDYRPPLGYDLIEPGILRENTIFPKLDALLEELATGMILPTEEAARKFGISRKDIRNGGGSIQRIYAKPIYKPFMERSDRGTLRDPEDPRKFGLGEHKALGTLEIWAGYEYWKKVRSEQRPWALYWREEGEQRKLELDPAYESILQQISSLYNSGLNAQEVGKLVHIDDGTVRYFLRDLEGVYGSAISHSKNANLGREFAKAHRQFALGIGEKRGRGRERSYEAKVLRALFDLGGSAATGKIAVKAKMSQRVYIEKEGETSPLRRLKDKGWVRRDPGHKGLWHLIDLEATEAFLKSETRNVPERTGRG